MFSAAASVGAMESGADRGKVGMVELAWLLYWLRYWLC